nr:putative ribonuclease H-like domain-containing protein [Tanacetum cinerariifolium]
MKKQKSISSTKTSSKFEAKITSSSYGFVWTNENFQYKWKANGVVERRNWTLVEAARTMLIFSRAPLFVWAEAIATACFTQNRFIIHYIGKLSAKGDIGFFIGSGLDLTYAPSTITSQQPFEGELDLLFEAMYDDYISGQPSATARTVPPAQEPQVRQSSTASPTIADTAPIPTNSSSLATNIPITPQDVNPFATRLLIRLQTHPQVLLHHHLNKMWIHRTCICFINHTLMNSNGLRITLWNK